MKHYSPDINQVIADLHTDSRNGLAQSQARTLAKQFGFNQLPEQKPPSVIRIFCAQFASPLIYILLLAAASIYIFSTLRIDAFIIVGILLFNAVVGTIQELRTRKIFNGLRQFFVQETVVIREGAKEVIENKWLVPGDIIIIQEGQRVPADARIIEAHELLVDESLLTGESVPVEKDGPQKNMLLSGTYIIKGWAKAVVIATGSATRVGAIQQSIELIQTDVPLAHQMERLSWLIIWIVLIMSAILLVIGLYSGKPFQELMVLLTALFICVVPEGLPVVVTVVLVSGVHRMAKQRVLVKNMQAVEGLGHAQVIVIDKTGTLTRNEMIVTHVYVSDSAYTVSGKGYFVQGSLFADGQLVHPEYDPALQKMAVGLTLLNTATITFVTQKRSFEVKGDPTQAALYVFAKKMEMDEVRLENEYKKLFEIPFDAVHKYHAAFYEHAGKGVGFITGAPEVIVHLTKADHKAQEMLSAYLHQGLRVVGVAVCHFDPTDMPALFVKNYFVRVISNSSSFLGWAGIEDAVRPEAVHTIARARRAGFQVIMATGDHQRTALSIAKQVGIYREGDEAVDGVELEGLSDEQLQEMMSHVTVFSRVSPDQKLRIINALHARHLLVAMTGDGINDAPSLVAADIGIAMGGIGSEVAKESADLILLDDSIKNIIAAIEEGRHSIYALRRVILYFFSTNLAEIFIILLSFICSILYPPWAIAFPLTAAQILWLNLITDGFLDSAIALEKKERGLLFEQKWFTPQKHIIDAPLIARMLWGAIPMAIGSFGVFVLFSGVDIGLARTMCLLTLSMFQWFNAWNCRSDTLSIFQMGLGGNRWLLLATILVIILQIALIYVPFLQTIFATQPLNRYQWLFAALVSSSILWLEEVRKWIIRRRS